MAELVTDEIVEVACREWWATANDGDAGTWDDANELIKRAERADMRVVLDAAAPLIHARALEEFARSMVHLEHHCFKPTCAMCREVAVRDSLRNSLVSRARRLRRKAGT